MQDLNIEEFYSKIDRKSSKDALIKLHPSDFIVQEITGGKVCGTTDIFKIQEFVKCILFLSNVIESSEMDGDTYIVGDELINNINDLCCLFKIEYDISYVCCGKLIQEFEALDCMYRCLSKFCELCPLNRDLCTCNEETNITCLEYKENVFQSQSSTETIINSLDVTCNLCKSSHISIKEQPCDSCHKDEICVNVKNGTFFDIIKQKLEKILECDINKLNIDSKTGRKAIYDIIRYSPYHKAVTVDGTITMTKDLNDLFGITVQKIMYNTVDACRYIATQLGISHQDIKFAGNKDKRAVTFQEMSVICTFDDLYDLAFDLCDEESVNDGDLFFETDQGQQLNKCCLKRLPFNKNIYHNKINDVRSILGAEKSSLYHIDEAIEKPDTIITNDEYVGNDNDADLNVSDVYTGTNSIRVIKKSTMMNYINHVIFQYVTGRKDALSFTLPYNIKRSKNKNIPATIKIFNIRRSSQKRLGDLSGNMFTIRIHNAKLLDIDNFNGNFINYFGPQRFGKYKNNHMVGKFILENKYSKAVDEILFNSPFYNIYKANAITMENINQYLKECGTTEKYILRNKIKGIDDKKNINGLRREVRMLYLHAYQSYIFNKSVNDRIHEGLDVFPDDYVSLNGKIVKVETSKPFAIHDIFIQLQKMNDRMLKGGYRKMIEKCNDLVVVKDDFGYIIRFWLNPSCYATMALREILGDIVLE